MTDEARPKDGERIAKMLARAGVASRRDIERMISEGRVTLNGRILDTPATIVTAKDLITVDGNPVAEAEPTRLWKLHKPRGTVTTARDPEGRPTVFSLLPPDMPRVITIGRLDLNSEGLLLLTNDGGLARTLELPATGWSRRYRVRLHGDVTQEMLDGLAKGVEVEGVRYGPIIGKLDRIQGANAWATITLKEGKNREIRRVMEDMGLTVTRLIRVSYGPFLLADMPDGTVEEIPRRILRDQLGNLYPIAKTEAEAAPALKPRSTARPPRTRDAAPPPRGKAPPRDKAAEADAPRGRNPRVAASGKPAAPFRERGPARDKAPAAESAPGRPARPERGKPTGKPATRNPADGDAARTSDAKPRRPARKPKPRTRL